MSSLLDDDYFYGRLCNWRAWCRLRAGPRILACQSLERRYRNRSGQWDYLYGADMQPRRIDERDAIELEEACCSLDKKARVLLRSSWVRGENYKASCRKAKINWLDFEWELDGAFYQLKISLEARIA